MHGFDKDCINYDENGVERNWWDFMSLREFMNRVDCMEEQYTNYTYKTYKVDGSATISENIADNGGAKIGYR